MRSFGSLRLVVAGLAALAVVAGGVGIGFMQLRAGEDGEQGPPNVDTRDWVSRRGEQGWLVRHPRTWPATTFNDMVARRFRHAGVVVASRAYEFRPAGSETVVFADLPPTLAAVQFVHRSGGPSNLTLDPDSPLPVALEAATPDRAVTGGLMLRIRPVADRMSGWTVNAWIGDAVGRRDAEIVRRIVSSFGFETAPPAAGLTLEEQMIAHEVAESYRPARTALKGRPHTHPGFATDQTGSPDCPNSRCGLVVFQITGGLRFRVLVDIPERRVIAFR